MKSHFAAIKLMAEEGNNKIVEIPTVAEGFHSRKDFDVEIDAISASNAAKLFVKA